MKGKPDPEARRQAGPQVGLPKGMPIVFYAGVDAQMYSEQQGYRQAPRPERCPHCQAVGTLIGHGSYPRKALDVEQVYPVCIRRWKCTACRQTVAMLPSFLLRFRHYLVAVIQTAVVGRYEQQRSWSRVEAQTAALGVPSRRTLGRWCQSFAQHAPAWLATVLAWLAMQDSASPALDPLGEFARTATTAQALLVAAVHLLAWAQAHWPVLAALGATPGLNVRLSVLWQWGHTHGLARLV